MKPNLKAAIRATSVIYGILGAVIVYSEVRSHQLNRRIDSARAQMRRDTENLLNWPANAPEDVKRVLFGDNR